MGFSLVLAVVFSLMLFAVQTGGGAGAPSEKRNPGGC